MVGTVEGDWRQQTHPVNHHLETHGQAMILQKQVRLGEPIARLLIGSATSIIQVIQIHHVMKCVRFFASLIYKKPN